MRAQPGARVHAPGDRGRRRAARRRPPLVPGRAAWRRARGPGVPYDVDAHPFTVAGGGEGRVTTRSRAELAQTVAARRRAGGRGGGRRRGGRRPDGPALATAAVATRALVEALLASGRPASAAEAARVLLAIRDRRASRRDAARRRRGRDGRAPAASLDRPGRAARRQTWWPRRRRCWPSPPGWRGTVRSPGAPSTGPPRATRPCTPGRAAWPRPCEQALPPSVWEEDVTGCATRRDPSGRPCRGRGPSP